MRFLIEDLKDQAKEYFGVTNNPKVAFYINTDGTLLDGSGKKLGSDGYKRSLDHRDISDIFDNGIDGYDAMLKYENEGNIRYIPETNGFELIREPTFAQYKVMQALINKFTGDCGVDIMDRYGNTLKSLSYEKPTQLLIEDVKYYFYRSSK